MSVTSVTVKASEGRPVKVISGDDEVFVGASESKTVEIAEGDELRVVPTDAPAPTELSADVWSPGNRPNGISQAIIAPKLPKAAGELKDIEEEGRLVQRQVAVDDATVTQGGGPETEQGETPGEEEMDAEQGPTTVPEEEPATQQAQPSGIESILKT